MVRGQAVRCERLTAVADALATIQGAHQTGDAGVDVHHGAAGEVERAVFEQVAARTHTMWQIGGSTA